MRTPGRAPIGLTLSRAAKSVRRAFDDTLAQAGGGLSSWLVLLSLKTREVGTQRELADAIGIRGATLTHHLNTMEDDGLLTRRRDPDNRRVHQVRLTAEGERLFHQLRAAAVDFDERLRADLTDDDLATLERILTTLTHNATR